MTATKELHLFKLFDGDHHWVVAESKEDALRYWYVELGGEAVDPRTTVEQYADDCPVGVMNDAGTGVDWKTAAEWVAESGGRCTLASTAN